MDQHGGHWPTTTVKVGFDCDTAGRSVCDCAQIKRSIGGEQDRFQEGFDTYTRLGRDVDEDRGPAVLLSNQVVLGQLLTDLGRVRTLFINLVNCDDDRNTSSLGMVECLNRLRHHAIICSDNKNRDISYLGATSTHSGERFVTRSIDESDRPIHTVMHGAHLVGTDVLGDSTGFAPDDVGLSNRIKQEGLTVINVTHDGYYWRTCHQVLISKGSQFGIQIDVELF
ncbi:hypothetical protein GALL_438100 [mine drainage metagenome]|uniref:Uncharacterized protein n=1 Tax=mine drainage metagenome TaxID=410659 RepID=A0A1J5PUK3_9ZZZZ